MNALLWWLLRAAAIAVGTALALTVLLTALTLAGAGP